MQVANTIPYKIIYSLSEHKHFGYLVSAYVVQINSKGELSYVFEKVTEEHLPHYKKGASDLDAELIKITDEMLNDSITSYFAGEHILLSAFAKKYLEKEDGYKEMMPKIRAYIEKRCATIFERLAGKEVYESGLDNYPAYKRIEIPLEKANVLFHFRRDEKGTNYFPTLKHEGEKLEFQYKEAKIVCVNPAYMLVNRKLYSFKKSVDGAKIKPFLNKKFIHVPKNLEDTYYRKFIAPLVGQFDVYAQGFEIKVSRGAPKTSIHFKNVLQAQSGQDLFGAEGTGAPAEAVLFELSFRYEHGVFSPREDTAHDVRIEQKGEEYIFYKTVRHDDAEAETMAFLKSTGLKIPYGKIAMPKKEAFRWIAANSSAIKEKGIELIQEAREDGKKYFIGSSAVDIIIDENNDWFDVRAFAVFGEFKIKFVELRKLILGGQDEFILPDGQIAVIPEEWKTQYADLLHFSEQDEDLLKLKKQHFGLLKALEADRLATLRIDQKLEALHNFEKIEDCPLPQGLNGTLRPYQKAGYNWLSFLREYKFGGCLADDMGLGKTVQALAMLLKVREEGLKRTSLLVVPTSLLYNWIAEAEKFAPSLKILPFFGAGRLKSTKHFPFYDLVLTTYGTARRDADLLGGFYFHYILLDEAHAIKNPSSQIAESMLSLKGEMRLSLTGTPVENSSLDLWAQMNFLNRGLLGTQAYFKKHYLNPIEKGRDDAAKEKLYHLTKPFILRREKGQVAQDLPEKIENIRYCSMTDEQAALYEKTKSAFRNQILQEIDLKGVGGSHFAILQGLTQLRQIANHPKMVDITSKAGSGKMEDVSHIIETLIQNKHKALVFSQFVKHLQLVKTFLDESKIPYAYLDGSTDTAERQRQVAFFQENDRIKIFLISLKAGGTGLNLTAADYVLVLDPWWNPAAELQAIDRAHRIGQTKTVFTYKLITKDTVEEKILALQQRKLALAGDLIKTEESFAKSLDAADIEELFR